MPRSAPETLNNGEQSLDFTYYEQTTNRFWSPHLAESKVEKKPKMPFFVTAQPGEGTRAERNEGTKGDPTRAFFNASNTLCPFFRAVEM